MPTIVMHGKGQHTIEQHTYPNNTHLLQAFIKLVTFVPDI